MPLPTDQDAALAQRYAAERRRQLTVLLVLAAAVLLISVAIAGVHNVFLPGWWRIDLP